MRDLAKYQADYAEQPYERYQVKFRKRMILAALERYPHEHVLEIGCGLEPLFRDFEDFDSLTVVEPGEHFFQRAEAEVATHKQRDHIRLVCSRLEAAQPQLAGRQFDFIVLSSLLHEVESPGEFLRQVHALAGPETVLHVNVPNALSFHRLLAFESGLIADPREPSASNVLFQQHTVFDLRMLTTLAGECGFVVLDSGSYALKPFTHRQMHELMQAGVLSEQVIEGLYNMEKYAPGCGAEIFVNLKKARA